MSSNQQQKNNLEKLKIFHENKCKTYQKINRDIESLVKKINDEQEMINKYFDDENSQQYSEEMLNLTEDYKNIIKQYENELKETMELNDIEIQKLKNMFDCKSFKNMKELEKRIDDILIMLAKLNEETIIINFGK